MRSRDGNQTLIRRSLQIIFLFFIARLYGDEYLISYRYATQNMTLYNESLFVSPAMQQCNGEALKNSLLITTKEKNLNKILQRNHEEFMRYLQTIGLEIQAREKLINTRSNSSAILTFRTHCFKVDFNDNFVKIRALK